MEATTTSHNSIVNYPAFSFATKSPWQGFDVETMRIHARARVVQSKLRANRLRRQNVALRHLLEVAQAHGRAEKQVALTAPEIIDLRARRESRLEANRLGASKDTRRIVEDRERSALLDLRRQHADRVREELSDDRIVDLRASFPTVRSGHPRSAIASRRWG